MFEQPGFGRRLRQLRLQQGKSQADLTGPGMSAAYLSRLESGARRPTDRVVSYLAERLGILVDEFDEHSEDDLADLVLTLSSRPDGERDAEIGDLLKNALDSATDVDPSTRWQALSLFARTHAALGEFDKEREILAELRTLSEELDRPVLQAHVLQRVARCCRNLGDMEATRQTMREALELGRRHQLSLPAADLVRANLLLASAEAELGNVAEAARLSQEARESLPRRDGALAAETFWTAATVSTRQGNSVEAYAYVHQALAALDSREDLSLWVRLRLAAASLCLQFLPPRLDEAEELLNSVQPALHLTGTQQNVQEASFLQAQLAFQQGDLNTAEELVKANEGGLSLMTYRDQVRFKTLRELLAARRGDPRAGARLRDLATEVQTMRMPDLSAEVWRAAANSIAEATYDVTEKTPG